MALPLVWANVALPALRLNVRGRTAANIAFAAAYSLAFDGTPNWTASRGLRACAVVATVVTTGFAAALAIPAIRHRLAELDDRGPDVHTAEWAAVHIPVGTVLSEELIYRATLTPLLERIAGSPGTSLGALVFGLAHIRPAAAAGDSILATIPVTALAGAVFDRLYRRTGSALAPALAHLGLNAGGALAPHVARVLTAARP